MSNLYSAVICIAIGFLIGAAHQNFWGVFG